MGKSKFSIPFFWIIFFEFVFKKKIEFFSDLWDLWPKNLTDEGSRMTSQMFGPRTSLTRGPERPFRCLDRLWRQREKKTNLWRRCLFPQTWAAWKEKFGRKITMFWQKWMKSNFGNSQNSKDYLMLKHCIFSAVLKCCCMKHSAKNKKIKLSLCIW